MLFHFFLILACLNLNGFHSPGRHHHPNHSFQPNRSEICQFKNQAITVTGTFYCGCEKCCGYWSQFQQTASGTTPVEGKTLAVDPDVIPLGSQIIFVEVPDGLEYLQFNPDGTDKIFVAEDTGNPDFISGNRIDIYLNDHDLAIQLGVKQFVVTVIPPEN